MAQFGDRVDQVSAALSDVDIRSWTQRFDLLSDPNRLEILLSMHRIPHLRRRAGGGGRTFGEFGSAQALRVLRQQGWVTSTRIGRQVSYHLDDQTVHQLLHWIGAAHAS